MATSANPDTVATPDDRLNFFRLTRLILDDVSDVLRYFADDKCKLHEGCTVQDACKKGLCTNIRCNYPKQRYMLSLGDPKKWDPSLLCGVLLHFKKKWLFLASEEQGVIKLRAVRNDFFGHQPNASCSKADLHAAFAEVEAAYMKMNIPTKMIDSMKEIEEEKIAPEELLRKLSDAEERFIVEREQHRIYRLSIEEFKQDTNKKFQDVQQRVSGLEDETDSHQKKLEEHGEKIHLHGAQLKLVSEQIEQVASASVEQDSPEVSEQIELLSAKVEKNDTQVLELSARVEQNNSQFEQLSAKVEWNSTQITQLTANPSKHVEQTSSEVEHSRTEHNLQTGKGDAQLEGSDAQQYVAGTEPEEGNSLLDDLVKPFSAITIGDNSALPHKSGFDGSETSASLVIDDQLGLGTVSSTHDLNSNATALYKFPSPITESNTSGPRDPIQENHKDQTAPFAYLVMGMKPYTDMEKRIHTLESRLTQAQSEKAALEEQLDFVLRDNVVVHESKKELELTIIEKNEEITKLNAQLSQVRTELRNLQAEKDKADRTQQLEKATLQAERDTLMKVLQMQTRPPSTPHGDILLAEGVTIKEKISGKGAHGVVFKGYWRNRECAVKIIKDMALCVTFGLDPGAPDNNNDVQKFKKECECLMKLRHQNIVEVYNIFHAKDYPVILMELLQSDLGEFLQHKSSETQLLPLSTQLSLSRDIATGLKYLHSQDVVHRDICGDNILLTMREPVPLAKISDFSISKIISFDKPFSTLLSCRTGYIPPEVKVDPKDYDMRIDVFMFGVVLSQIISCFRTVSDETERQHLLESIPDDHPLRHITTRMTSNHKDERPISSDVAMQIGLAYDKVNNYYKSL